jgi:bacteriocin-like protein
MDNTIVQWFSIESRNIKKIKFMKQLTESNDNELTMDEMKNVSGGTTFAYDLGFAIRFILSQSNPGSQISAMAEYNLIYN